MLELVFVFSVFPLCCLVVITGAIDCLAKLVPKMTCYVSRGTFKPKHSLTRLKLEAFYWLLHKNRLWSFEYHYAAYIINRSYV